MFYLRALSFLILAAVGASAQTSSIRFDRQKAALDQVVGNCSDAETCILVTVRYSTSYSSRREGTKVFGGLNPWTRVSMIKVPGAPWLGLTPHVPNLRKEWHTLFADRSQSSHTVNGLNLPPVIDRNGSLYDSSMILPVTLNIQGSIYKRDQVMEIGKVALPQVPAEHELLQKSSFASDLSFTYGFIVPVKLRFDVKIHLKTRIANAINQVMIVGIPNQRGTTDEERGTPYVPSVIPLPGDFPIYRLEFVDLGGTGAQSLTSYDTVDD